jgi:hypothetical protein
MQPDFLSTLQSEFAAEEGSFALQLRPGVTWDAAAFRRLRFAMYACCQHLQASDDLPRWLACGFWFMPGFVREWVNHYISHSVTTLIPQFGLTG